ncbi:hypothetical protein Taro_021186, partial [Colocasia esculenta]|nr:hypothetical protein [Colocasia esculenta]
RVFCKKGCDADGETWDECVGECNEICYKDPVFKDYQWSAYIDRSPGAENYSMISQVLTSMQECFHACVSGCSYKNEMSLPWMMRFLWPIIFTSSFHALEMCDTVFSYSLPVTNMQFGAHTEEADQVQPNRPPKPAVETKSLPTPPIDPELVADNMPSTSA